MCSLGKCRPFCGCFPICQMGTPASPCPSRERSAELGAWSRGRVNPGPTHKVLVGVGGGLLRISVSMNQPQPSSAPGAREGLGTASSPRGRPASPAGRLLPGSARPPLLSRAAPAHFAQTCPPRPTPRQTPGSRPEEAHGRSTAPREPDPREGDWGSNLNTSPADPPHHAPPRPGRGVLAPGRRAPA